MNKVSGVMIKKYFRGLVLFASTLVLAGCKMAILEPRGIIAAHEKHLLLLSSELMLIVVIPVIILAILVAWRYRASSKKASYRPDWSHSTLLEAVWWTIPCIIIFALALITWFGTHELDPYKPLHVKGKKPVIIQAISLSWRWLFIYPEQKIATIDYIQVPIHTPVRLFITAEGPMNSLEIPQLAGQIYAMAGMRTQLNFMGNVKGSYMGLATNYTGPGFANMDFTVKVSSRNDFEKWVKKVQQSSQHLTKARYNKLAVPSADNKVQYFSSVAPDLFKGVMMKYMKPNNKTMATHHEK